MTRNRLAVLVIDDDIYMQDLLLSALDPFEYQLEMAASGSDTFERLKTFIPDIILLDRQLPDMDGLTICRTLRQQYSQLVPILMITARDSVADRIEGLEAGATDYILKPFDFEELSARIKAHFRTIQAIQNEAHPAFMGLALAPDQSYVMYQQQRLSLTPIELTLLQQLLLAAPHMVPRERLLQKAWPQDDPLSTTMESHISSLRRKLTQAQVSVQITAVYGQGYLLEAQAEPPQSN